MAVTTQAGVTTLTPTAWKWYVGAGLMGSLWLPISSMPGAELNAYLALIVAVFLALHGRGTFSYLKLTPDGFEYRTFLTHKHYRWSEVTDFKLRTVRTSLFTSIKLIAFSRVDKAGSMYGKFSKLVAGGTESMPVIGMPGKKLGTLMMAYQNGFVPDDTAATVPGATAPASTGSPARPAVPQAPQTAYVKPAPAPGKPRFGTRSDAGGSPKPVVLVEEGRRGLFR